MTEQERARLLELEMRVENCQNNVKNDIEDLKKQHKELSAELREQAIARKEFNGVVNTKIDALSDKIDSHTNDEMNTITDILRTLKDLVITTRENTDAIKTISKTTDNNNDFIENVKRKWFMLTSIGLGIGGTLGSLYWLYKFLDKNGIVFVIEKAV